MLGLASSSATIPAMFSLCTSANFRVRVCDSSRWQYDDALRTREWPWSPGLSLLTQSVGTRVCSLDISGGTADRAGEACVRIHCRCPESRRGLHPQVLRSDVLPIARSAPGTPVPALMAALIERRPMEMPRALQSRHVCRWIGIEPVEDLFSCDGRQLESQRFVLGRYS